MKAVQIANNNLETLTARLEEQKIQEERVFDL
jgi:hypothetical protein